MGIIKIYRIFYHKFYFFLPIYSYLQRYGLIYCILFFTNPTARGQGTTHNIQSIIHTSQALFESFLTNVILS